MAAPRNCHPRTVNSCLKSRPYRGVAAFSLIEMVAVIAILVTLMTAGVSLLNGTGNQSRKAATDLLTGLIEQARTTAITTRSHVVLVIAEPGDLPAQDERCRIGLFRVDDWPDSVSSPVTLKGVLLSRWQTLNSGVILLGGSVSGSATPNPLDLPQATITYAAGNKTLNVVVHAIAFNSRGGLDLPAGSTPVVLRIAEGNYRKGKAVANKRAGQTVVTENILKIGRVTARPYRIDG